MAGVGLLHGVHREPANRVDRESLYVLRGHASILEAAPARCPPASRQLQLARGPAQLWRR
jgi:hypothetical protein